jgi:SPOR domain
MLSKGLFAAVFVATFGVSGAFAQSIADIGGPRELPPSSFKGQQYVDSRGCVFLRAGYGGQVNWVPRVNRERKVLCGYPSTFGARQVAAVEPEPTPAPVTRAAPAPMETVASTMAPEAPRVAVRQPAVRQPTATEVAQVAAPVIVATQPGSRKIGCFSNSPVPVRVALTNGGTAVICTRGDGTLEGARAPIYPPGSGLQASVDQPGSVVNNTARVTSRVTGTQAPVVMAEAAPAPVVVPRGYKLAWDDDRLNPNRGRGTARGQAQQDQVWTRDVPAVLVADVATKPAPTGGRVTVSTMSDATAPVAQSGAKLYVQVGTFGVPENATGAKARLAALGLPTARGNLNQGGQALQIIYAGPFASAADAKSALNAARGAGFGDAFIR